MKDIELVIKVSEDSYKATCIGSMLPSDVENVINAIKNGKPLPKGHGRLIDADKELAGLKEMKVVDETDKQSVRFAILEFEYAKPIIKADKAESEEVWYR